MNAMGKILTGDRMKGQIFLAAWVGIVLLNAVLLPPRYAPRVVVEQAVLKPLPLEVSAPANLEAKDSNTIKAQFDGLIITKSFHEGQVVTKGQLLAVLDREKIQIDYDGKRDALKNAQSDLDRARKDLRLEKVLFKREAVSYSSVEDAQRAVVKGEQGLRSAQETFDQAQETWDSNRIISPIAGTVVKDWVGDDKSVSSGKEIVTVADVSEYTVHARVDELYVHEIQEGMKAVVRLAVFPQNVFTATVTSLGSLPEGNGLPEIPVVMSLDDTQGQLLRPKLSADVRIELGATPPTLSIPLTALMNADDKPKVWVVGPLDRLRLQTIALGKSNPDRVQVLGGLAVGDKVCVKVDPAFSSGMHVIWSTSPNNP